MMTEQHTGFTVGSSTGSGYRMWKSGGRRGGKEVGGATATTPTDEQIRRLRIRSMGGEVNGEGLTRRKTLPLDGDEVNVKRKLTFKGR